MAVSDEPAPRQCWSAGTSAALRRQSVIQVSETGELSGIDRPQIQISVGELPQPFGIVQHGPFRRQQAALLA